MLYTTSWAIWVIRSIDWLPVRLAIHLRDIGPREPIFIIAGFSFPRLLATRFFFFMSMLLAIGVWSPDILPSYWNWLLLIFLRGLLKKSGSATRTYILTLFTYIYIPPNGGYESRKVSTRGACMHACMGYGCEDLHTIHT